MGHDHLSQVNSGTAACGLCAGGRLVLVVHVGAGKAAERWGLLLCTGGQEV